MTSKKLLVLDVNGLLVDTYFYKEPLPEESPDAKVGSFYVYKRPFCEEFLQFCLENFTVGIWSSAREYNVNNLVDYVFGVTKEKLAFSWHQSDCTDLGLKSPDNQWKPLFLKELSKLWRKVKMDLPWKEGNYGPSNTLLVDDTPYKAILNPPNTAIFPRSYTARDRGDNFLGGALRSYLEGIRDAASVQTYVESNPFGEPSITPASPLWSYVNDVVLKVKNVLNNVGDGVAQIVPVETVSDEGNKEEKLKKWHGKWTHHSDPVEEVMDEDNKAGKRNRWRNRKQKYLSDSLQLANNHFQPSDFDFPCEAVESQSSDCMLQPLGSCKQVHGSHADQQVDEIANLVGQTDWVCSHSNQPVEEQERPLQVGKGIISLPSSLEEPSDALQDNNSFSTELEAYDGDNEERHKNPRFVLSFEQGHQGVLESAKQAASMQEDPKRTDNKHEDNQASHDENHRSFDKGPFMTVIDAGIDAELDRLHEQHKNDADGNIHGEGNESNEKLHIPVRDNSLKAAEPYCMQAESNSEELFCWRQETRDNNLVRASNNNYASQNHLRYSNRRWHKHTGTWEDENNWHNPRHDSNRGRFSYPQGGKREERYHQGSRGQTPSSKHFDERGHRFANKQHMKYVDRHDSSKGYRNSIKPPFGYARYSHQRWGDRPPAQPAWGASTHDSRSWDQSQQDYWQFSNTKTPTNADSNFSTSQRGSAGRVRKYDEYGQGQDGDPWSCSWQQGFEQAAVCERSNLFPERIEQLNVNVHNPDSNYVVQAETRGNGKRQRYDFASKEVGASSQPQSRVSRQPYQNVEAPSGRYRNAEAFNQPYRGQHQGSRQPYHNVGAYQPNHNSWDKYRQGLPPGGFSRSRQSQEVRNL